MRSGRDRTHSRAKGGQTRAEESTAEDDRRDISQKCGLVDENGGWYEAGFVRRGGVGADTVFGNSWSWKGEVVGRIDERELD